MVQEFWDYDDVDRKKAKEISHRFKAVREAELEKARNRRKR